RLAVTFLFMLSISAIVVAQSTGQVDKGSAGVVATAAGEAPPAQWLRTLVVVQLQGGNDGLNMIVPYSDPLYYRLRPTLAVPRSSVLPLDSSLGLNPTMKALLPIWNKHQMAVVLGVGYPNPNRSHFRGTDIWETGSGSGQVLETGWLDRLVNAIRPPSSLIADGAILGGLGQGPLAGPGIRTISMSDPAQFIVAARQLQRTAGQGQTTPGSGPANQTGEIATYGTGPLVSSSPLQLLMTVQVNLTEAADRMAALKEGEPHLKTLFPKTRFGTEMKNAAELIAMGANIPIIKVQLGGFDTHWDESVRQDPVLADLADSLASFRSAMEEAGTWNRVLVLTYSEFGRRVIENGSKGTDHGTAEPLLLLGGEVAGGLYGKQPSLTNLDFGDLRFTTDYRSVYLSVAEGWFGMGGDAQRLFPGTSPGQLTLLPLLKGKG
ncbi:MAG TPA: DUF1501 domain-containing protein, partial [Spirochaetia bacterium]|nr:DUF1501 domain-containing protein [Spirochaetia bacterium]